MGHWLSNVFSYFVLSFFIFGFLSFSLRHSFYIWIMFWLLGGLTQILTLLTMPASIRLIGASGILFIALGFWLIHFWSLARQKSFFSRGIRVIGVAIVFLIPEKFSPEVSYMAHGIGLTIGFIFGLGHFYFFKKRYRSFEIFGADLESMDSSIDPDSNFESEVR